MTLTLGDTNLAAAVDALTSKSSLSLSLTARAEGAFPLKLDDVLVTEALREVCAKGRLWTLAHSEGLIQLEISTGDGAAHGLAYRNVAFLPYCVYRLRVADFAGAPRDVLSLSMALVFHEMRVAGPIETDVIEAVDDRGRVLSMAREAVSAVADEDLQTSRFAPWLTLDFAWPAGAKKIARLRGSITVHFPTKTTELAFAELAAGREREADGFRAKLVRVDPLVSDESGVKAQRLVVELRPDARGLEHLRRFPPAFRAGLADGTPLQLGLEARLGRDGEVRYEAHPRPIVTGENTVQSRDAATLAIEIVRETAPRRLYFEFVDLPIE